ncbi:hypothetical protein B296_00014752 [Ensete ventricosum]|uniref:Uncharacterized protein n=1 Tax=Ensete ventricosum TaxID=4639 RepID=A0A427AMX5_ENSVE|nr:hypothetical protein B296_00014752 [Ensete ventricosum]
MALYVETTAFSLLSVGQPMMALYTDGSTTTMNGFISVSDLGSSPIVTGKVVVPRGEMESPVNPVDVIGTRSCQSDPILKRHQGDLEVTVASWPLFYCGSCICSARRRAIASRSGSADNNINLFFYGPLWVGRRISGMSTLGSWMSVTDIAAEVPLANKVFNLVFEVMALLGVMFMLLMEATISSPISPLGADQIRRPEEPLLSDLEENLYPGRI